MVKIRGTRVNLSDVRESFASVPGVQESVVLARPLPDGSVRLAAFVVTDPAAPCTAEKIRKGLSALLPDYMIPGEIVFLDHLPLNANGKIDRMALLRRMESDATLPPPPEDVSTSSEALLARVWTEVFGVHAGRQTNFFNLGGDSLNAGVVAAKVESTL